MNNLLLLALGAAMLVVRVRGVEAATSFFFPMERPILSNLLKSINSLPWDWKSTVSVILTFFFFLLKGQALAVAIFFNSSSPLIRFACANLWKKNVNTIQKNLQKNDKHLQWILLYRSTNLLHGTPNRSNVKVPC